MRAAGFGFALLIVLLPPAAGAQDLGAAHDFVVGLYGAYHGDGPDYLGRQAGAAFSPPLLKLIRRAAAATPKDEVGALDGDPICDCQDFQISKVRVQVASEPSGHARATVHFVNFAEPQTVGLDLVVVSGHWRVSDVHTADTPSLVSYLTQSLGRSH